MDVLHRALAEPGHQGFALFVLNVGGDHARAFFHEGLHRREADTTCCARNDGDFSFQICHAIPPFSFWE